MHKIGFYIPKNGKVGFVGQFIIMIIFSIIALTAILDLVGLFKNSSQLFATIVLFSSISVVLITFFYRDFMVFRTAYRMNKLSSRNDFDKASKLINKKIKLNFLGYKPNWLALKSMLLIKKGELKVANDILDKLKKKYPHFLSMIYYKACLESIKGNKKRSLHYLKKYNETMNEIIDQYNNPISKKIMIKRKKYFISIINLDEDLLNVRKTGEFKDFLNKIKYDRNNYEQR